MKTRKKSVFICEKNLRLSARKTTLLFSLILLLFSCIKLEENDKKYSARKLQKMLEGTWELTDYQIDGISYLDTFLKVNTHDNCKTYTFTQWKNSGSNKGPHDEKTGKLKGDCQTQPSSGYEFIPRKKYLSVGWSYFRDSIYFFMSTSFEVLKLEGSEMLWTDQNEGHIRKIYFIKQ
jgi:hypothetical protein